MNLIVDETGETMELLLWREQPTRRQRQGETRRGSFAPGFVTFGDMMIDPHKITLRGPLGEAHIPDEELQARRDALYLFVTSGDMWIVKNERRMKISNLRDDEEIRQHKGRDNLSTFSMSFDVLRWWESVIRQQINLEIHPGEFLYHITYGGNRESYPWLTFHLDTVNEDTTLEITMNSRRLIWQFIDLETGSMLDPEGNNLVIDSERGLVWFNGYKAPFQISDHSSMLAIEPGVNNIIINHTGSGGLLEFSYREAFETS